MGTPTQTHEPRSPIPFRERVMALAGHGLNPEPTSGGGSINARRAIPTDHLVAAALSFGRENRDDIGPDIAFDKALGRSGHYGRVCEWLAKELGRRYVRRKFPEAVRTRAWVAHIAVYAYRAYVHDESCPPAPEGIREQDWRVMIMAGFRALECAAEDALSLAARRARAEDAA